MQTEEHKVRAGVALCAMEEVKENRALGAAGSGRGRMPICQHPIIKSTVGPAALFNFLFDSKVGYRMPFLAATRLEQRDVDSLLGGGGYWTTHLSPTRKESNGYLG